jgi:hypothetical protein
MHPRSLLTALLTLQLSALLAGAALAKTPADPKGPPSPSVGRGLKTLWTFEGPLAPSLKAIVKERYSARAAEHIFERAELEAHLAATLTPASLAPLEACARDERTCDLGQLLLEGGSLSGRAFVSAQERPEGGFTVRVTWYKADAVAPERFSVTEPTLERACALVFGQALQVGTLVIKGLPPGATLSQGERQVPLLEGKALLEAGEHELTVSAPDHEPIIIKAALGAGLTTELQVKMVVSSATFKLMVLGDERMQGLKATLNGEPLIVDQVVRLPSKREHTLRVEAEDRAPYDLTFTLSPSEARTQTVELPLSRAPWKIALRTPHPDVQASTNQVYARFRSARLAGGSWGADVSGSSGAAKEVQSQSYPAGAWGFDAGFRWNVDPASLAGSLQLDLVGVGYQRVEGPIALNEGTPGQTSNCDKRSDPPRPCEGLTLNELNRTLTRLLWVGYQLPMWRVTPYLNAGLLWVYESGSLKGGGDVSAHSLRLGWEAGVDMTLSPEWVVKMALVADAWMDSRASYQLAIGAAYAFTLL